MTTVEERDALLIDDEGNVSLYIIDACIDWYDFTNEKEYFACAKLDKCYSGYFEWFKEKNGYYPSPSEKTLNSVKLDNAYALDSSIMDQKDLDGLDWTNRLGGDYVHFF